MKKYEKPDLIIERFELSHNIANCNSIMNYGSEEKCTTDNWEETSFGYTVFTDTNVDCKYPSSQWESYCKFTGSESVVLFTS